MEASKTPNLEATDPDAPGHRYQGPQNFPKHTQVVEGLSGMFQGHAGVFLESTHIIYIYIHPLINKLMAGNGKEALNKGTNIWPSF